MTLQSSGRSTRLLCSVQRRMLSGAAVVLRISSSLV